MRQSIEITSKQQRLKASAALIELEAFLKPRVNAANYGKLSKKTVDDIFDQVLNNTPATFIKI